jgi:hypothetical protein
MRSQRNHRRAGITERHMVLYFYSTQQRVNTIDSQDEHFHYLVNAKYICHMEGTDKKNR